MTAATSPRPSRRTPCPPLPPEAIEAARARVAASRAALEAARLHRAGMALAGTLGGAGGFQPPPRCDGAAGAPEAAVRRPDGLVRQMREMAPPPLTARQFDAADFLADTYSRGGGWSPWRRTPGGTPRPEGAVAAARAEFAGLIEAAPSWTRPALLSLAMGEAPIGGDPLPAWRAGLDAIADRLRLAE